MNVVCYYNELSNWKASTNNLNLLKVWEKNWKNKGWNPIVLSEADAKEHSDFDKINFLNDNSILTKNSQLPKEYVWNCYKRWFAYAKVATDDQNCIWTDFDVMNINLSVDQALQNNYTKANIAFCGSLCSGNLTSTGANALINYLIKMNEEDSSALKELNNFLTKYDKAADINDMIVVRSLNLFRLERICTSFLRLGNLENLPFDSNMKYKQNLYPLAHFHHGIFSSDRCFNFFSETKDRTDIIKDFFKTQFNEEL